MMRLKMKIGNMTPEQEKEFDEIFYEPEHVAGIGSCWCGVTYTKEDGVTHINHVSQREKIKAFINRIHGKSIPSKI